MVPLPFATDRKRPHAVASLLFDLSNQAKHVCTTPMALSR